MSDMAILYTTWPDEESAAAAAETLLDERLIACANVMGPARSIFRWKGETCLESETVVLFKTGAAHAGTVRDRLIALHPYEEPAIVQLGVETTGTSPAFAAWVAAETPGAD
ncbi:divalent-cation tolerance protein CutA [Maricaulaceae bacterium MS644]